MQSSQTITIVYPHQLFRISETESISAGDTIVMIEEPLFFTRLRFHKQKILLHRASMQAYQDYLRKHDCTVHYLSATDFSDTRDVLEHIADTLDPQSVDIIRPSDYLLKKRITQWSNDENISLNWCSSPLFMTPRSRLAEFFVGKDTVRMADFYKRQRREMDILVTADGEPEGGQWSFDEENREPLPKDKGFPQLPNENKSHYVKEAKEYVREHFDDHYGSIDGFFYPVTRRQALNWLESFFADRFTDFGPYEDAFSKDSHSYLWHSVLTPFLNIGLVTPQEVVDKATSFADKHDVPINSLEGFIRQVIGWREFMHGLYLHKGSRVRSQNFFDHTRELPEGFWSADTGMPPVDTVIEKVLQTGYAHHIERLMVLANYMILTEIHPHHAYGWFMEFFVDAYDWVMVPNVYSMGLFADGGVMATKPYISSSNYLTKMSDWQRDKDNPDHWSYQWDALYWRFLDKHRDFFEGNARLSRVTSHLDRMAKEELAEYKQTAESYLTSISKQASRFDNADRAFFAQDS